MGGARISLRARAAERAATGVLLALVLAPPAAALLSGAPGGRAVEAWTDSRNWEALGRTIELAALAALLATPLAWGLVAAAWRCGPGWTAACVGLSCTAMLAPASLLATAWAAVTGPTHPVGRLLEAWRPGFDIYSLPAAAAVLALRYFGLAAAVAWREQARWSRAAPVERVFAVPPWARWRRLRLRPAARAMAGGAALVMLFAMHDHILPSMLLVSTYGERVMVEYVARMAPASAAATAAPAALVGMVLLAIVWRLAGGAEEAGEGAPVAALREGAARRIAGAAFSLAILAAALAVPIGVLAAKAGSLAAPAEAVGAAGREVRQTLVVAGLSAGFCTLAGAVLAGAWRRRRGALWLALAPLAAPASLTAIGVVVLTARTPLRAMDGTVGPLVLACVTRFTPVAALALLILWRGDRCEADLAAAVHGVGFWRRLWRVTWPRRRLSLLAAALLCGVLTATELEMAVLLAPPGGAMLATRLYTLAHTAPEAMVSALTLALWLPAAAGAVTAGALSAVAARRQRAR